MTRYLLILILCLPMLGRAAAPRVPLDFNGDGKSDALWVNSDGSAALWLMNGTTVTGQATFSPGSGWSLMCGDADFNGDGKSDLVWTRFTGEVAIWLMDGLTATSQTSFGPFAGWTLVSANQDFNGDGQSDLLWQNTNGQVAIWLMSGSSVLSTATYGPYAGWRVVSGNNDFNGDGKSDLLWTSTSGAAAVWQMNGTTVTGTATFGPYAGWSVVSGDADYNGDGRTDLLWQNTNGQVSVWLMNGLASAATAVLGPNPGWTLVPGRRDFNGDSWSDLLWTNASGAAQIWQMNGTSVGSQVTFGPCTGWSLLGGRGDYNGDGRTDLLWTSTAGELAFTLVNGATWVGESAYGPYTGWAATDGLSPGGSSAFVSTVATGFTQTQGVALDPAGNILVDSYSSNFTGTISRVSPTGLTTSLPVLNQLSTSFFQPAALAVDGAGNVYVATGYTDDVLEFSAGGVASVLAGTALQPGSADGPAFSAGFYGPQGVAVDAAGTVYVADSGNNQIRVITGGVVSALAGSTVAGAADGTGASASFFGPSGVAVDGAGNVYVADSYNNLIRKVTPAGVTTTLAGSTTPGFTDGTGAAASFWSPRGVAVDGSGNVYVADSNNNRIRKVTPGGVVTTIAGAGTTGANDGSASSARLNYPVSVAVDAAGNLYVADSNNNSIRRIVQMGP